MTATRTVTVDVTQPLIDGGVRGHCSLCPIARAVSLAACQFVALCRFAVVFVDSHGATVGLYDFCIELPPEVVSFIRDFDAGRAVRPIAFPLRVPVITEAR